jgi:TetR/AcrR family transcriptional repressor of nem operon
VNTSKTEKTRQHIIAATAGLFNKKGYSGTSITDITQATQLTSGSIYGNFTNKEEVALAVFDYNLANFRKVEQDAVSRCESNADKLLMSVQAYHSSQGLTFPEGGCPMQNTLTEADDTHEALRKRAAAGLLQWKKELVTIIEQGKATNEFHHDTDADKTALHILALIEFGFLMGSATQNRKQVDTLLDIATEFIQTIRG